MRSVETQKTIGDRVHESMQAIYGASYIRQWQSVSPAKMKEMWEFALSKFSEREIQAGLNGCLLRKYPPNLPEFLDMCRPQIDFEDAFHQAVAGLSARRQGLVGDWSHPAIYYTAIQMASEVLSGTYKQHKSRWDSLLSAQLEVLEYDPIPSPPLQLETQHTTSSSAKQVVDIKTLVSDALSKKDSDPVGWARRILANPKGKAIATITKARIALNEYGDSDG